MYHEGARFRLILEELFEAKLHSTNPQSPVYLNKNVGGGGVVDLQCCVSFRCIAK